MDSEKTAASVKAARAAQEEESRRRIEALTALPGGSHIHVVGVSGAGTAQLAVLLKELGFRVSGSDKAFYPPAGPLVKETVDQIFDGFSADNLTPSPDWVVIGNSVLQSNPEAVEAEARSIPCSSMPETLAAFLIGDREQTAVSVVAAGTHGKTTTSSAVAELLDACGAAPGFFIGGVPSAFSSGLRQADSSKPAAERVVVLEGDEYDSAYFAKWPKFHSYRPDILIITSLDFDHGDIYSSIEEIEAEFHLLVRRVPESGCILVNDSHDRLDRLAAAWEQSAEVAAQVLRYGEKPDSPYHIVERTAGSSGQRLVLSLAGEKIESEVNLIGRHNAHNLAAAAAVGSLLNIGSDAVARGLSAVKGVKRRQQVAWSGQGIVLIDDFAHHPAEVAATLSAVKEAFPAQRTVAVFEPRSNTSRRDYFQQEYSASLAIADRVLIKEVEDAGGYSKTSGETVKLDVPLIIQELRDLETAAEFFARTEDIIEYLKDTTKTQDVVVVMSNGSFDGLVENLKVELNQIR